MSELHFIACVITTTILHAVPGRGQYKSQGYLGFFAEVRRELEAGDVAPVVSHYDDGINGVELDVGELGLLLGHHGLLADGFVLVNAQVEDVNLNQTRTRSPLKTTKDNRRVWFLIIMSVFRINVTLPKIKENNNVKLKINTIEHLQKDYK